MSDSTLPRTLLLTPAEAGEELRISDDSVMRLIAAGEIQAVNVGTAKKPRTRVTRAALQKFIDSRTSDRPRTSQVTA